MGIQGQIARIRGVRNPRLHALAVAVGLASGAVHGQATPGAGDILQTLPPSVSRPSGEPSIDTTQVQRRDGTESERGQVAPGAGEILQSLPPTATRPSGKPAIDSALTQRRAVVDVEGMRLEIKGFRLSGLTVMAEPEFAEALSPFVGPDKRFQDLLDAAAAAKRELAGRGYFLADVIVPEQKISEGVVELLVLEGRLGKVRLEIDSDVSVNRGLIESYVGNLEEGGLIRTGEVERALFQIHDLRGVVATSSFGPGEKAGTADLTIKVKSGKAFNANVDFDANGSIYTGMHRVGAGMDANGLLGFGELLSVRANNALDGNLRYARASALFPIGPWGSKIGFAYSDLQYRLGTSLFAALKANGQATVYSFTGVHPFIRSRNTNLLLTGLYDKRTFYDIQLNSGNTTNKASDVGSLTLSGDFRDRLLGGGINIFGLTYTLGELKFGTAGEIAADQAGRKTGGLYGKTNINLSRLQAVSERLALYGAYTQQFTNKNLDPSEKLSLGGPGAVRAYPQGEGAGDEGYFGTLEMRYRLPVEDSVPGTMVFTTFYDFGRSILIKRPSAADTAANAALIRRVAGAGVGLNWEVPNDWYLRTSLAFRDTSKATADHLLRYPRVYFQFSKFF